MSGRGDIRLKNVFYMLSYSYTELREGGRVDLSDEDFDDAMDLFAAILYRGVSSLVGRGLSRDYVRRTEPLAFPKGKFEMAETVRSRSLDYRKVVCSYDEHSEDTRLNRIVKAGMLALCSSDRVDVDRKRGLRLMLDYFGGVSNIDLRTVRWEGIRYRHEDAPYRLLVLVCRIVARCMFIRETEGERGVDEYIDDELMYRLFENFLAAYFREEHPELEVWGGARTRGARSGGTQIAWDVDGGCDSLGGSSKNLLPVMDSDVRIVDRGTRDTLIVDAKWYQDPTPSNQYGNDKVRSAHLYQILSYVKNHQRTSGNDGHVSGMLVYPEQDVSLDLEYPIGGNRIWVRSVDLGGDFHSIRDELDSMIRTWKDRSGPYAVPTLNQ